MIRRGWLLALVGMLVLAVPGCMVTESTYLRRSEDRKRGRADKNRNKSCLHSDLLLFLSSSLHAFMKALSGGRPFFAASLSNPVPGDGVLD